MSKNQQDVSLGKGALFFAVVGVLGLVASPFAGFYGVIGGICLAIAVLLGLLWWINFANRKKV